VTRLIWLPDPWHGYEGREPGGHVAADQPRAAADRPPVRPERARRCAVGGLHAGFGAQPRSVARLELEARRDHDVPPVARTRTSRSRTSAVSPPRRPPGLPGSARHQRPRRIEPYLAVAALNECLDEPAVPLATIAGAACHARHRAAVCGCAGADGPPSRRGVTAYSGFTAMPPVRSATGRRLGCIHKKLEHRYPHGRSVDMRRNRASATALVSAGLGSLCHKLPGLGGPSTPEDASSWVTVRDERSRLCGSRIAALEVNIRRRRALHTDVARDR
jgi:hypothetical protein